MKFRDQIIRTNIKFMITVISMISVDLNMCVLFSNGKNPQTTMCKLQKSSEMYHHSSRNRHQCKLEHPYGAEALWRYKTSRSDSPAPILTHVHSSSVHSSRAKIVKPKGSNIWKLPIKSQRITCAFSCLCYHRTFSMALYTC